MEDQNKYDLFDRYIRGELNGEQLDKFLERLESDLAFKEEYASYHLVVEGIREHERQELRTYMEQKARVRFMGNPWSKTWTYASAAVVMAFGVLYIALDQKNGNEAVAVKEQQKKQALNDTLHEMPEPEKENVAMEAPIAETITEQAPVPAAEIVEEEQYIDIDDPLEEAEEMVYPDPLNNEGLVRMEQDDELPVKADTRVYDTVVSLALSFDKENKVDTAHAEIVKKKEIKGRTEKIVVQFWKSPINYKGYLFDGRKLEVFGLDTFSQVSLRYRVLNVDLQVYEVYLKYGETYFKLVEDNRYHAYVKVKDPMIIEELK